MENADDLIADMQQALDAACRAAPQSGSTGRIALSTQAQISAIDSVRNAANEGEVAAP